MSTNIRISKTNRDKLVELKTEHGYKNLDEVITHLVEVNAEYEKGKIVRMVRVIE